jgi:undecaprenyl-diphosphatase
MADQSGTTMREANTPILDPSSDDTYPPPWVLVRGVQRLWGQLKGGWTELRPERKRAYLLTLVVGWVLTAGATVLVVLLARSLSSDEAPLLLRLAEASPLSFTTAIWAETPGNTLPVFIVTLVGMVIALRWNRPLRAYCFLAAFLLSMSFTLLGWTLWDRARPDIIAGGIAAPGWHSFPSGHVMHTITVYGVLIYCWIGATRSRSEKLLAWLVLAALVLVVAVSRLELGAHWPSDVLASMVVGASWLATLLVALRRAEENPEQVQRGRTQ